MLYRWRVRGKPSFVSDEVWHSWQHKWTDASFQSMRECQSRNHQSETGSIGSGPSRYTCGSISIAEHARQIEMKEGAPPSKVRLFNETHMRRAPNRSKEYVDQGARQVGELISTTSQDEYGNQIDLTQDDEDRIFLEAIEASSQSRYMYKQAEINHPALHPKPLHPLHPSLRQLINVLESLRNHTLSYKMRYMIYVVLFIALMR